MAIEATVLNLDNWPNQLPKIVHAVLYWLMSLWLVFLAIFVVSNLVDIYANPEDLRRLYWPFYYYKVIIWVCAGLTGVAVAAQVRRVRLQRISPVALFAAVALPTIQFAIGFRYLD